MTRELRHLLNKVNAVTAPHRHGNPVSKRKLDDLANAQVEYEQALPGMIRRANSEDGVHEKVCMWDGTHPGCQSSKINHIYSRLPVFCEYCGGRVKKAK